MKKVISTLMIVIIFFNLIFCSDTYAVTDSTASTTDSMISASEQYEFIENGSIGGVVLDIVSAITGAVPAVLCSIFNIVPIMARVIMYCLAENTDYPVTICNLIFNKIPIFNIDYFNYEETYTMGITRQETFYADKTNKALKEGVAKFFIIFRLISIGIALIILVYVGIRMAFSTLSNDKARYKKMLMGWFESILILFFMPYIIEAIMVIGKCIENVLFDMYAIINTNETSFEDTVYEKIVPFMGKSFGWTFVAYSIMFWFLTFLQSKFFISYARRLLSVGFLILISPLISVIYAIDKAGDGKSQSFSIWLKELMVNIFIQPIYQVVYLIFMITAGEIAQYSLFFAFAIMIIMTKVEKYIFTIFGLKSVTLKQIDKEKTISQMGKK